MPFGHDGTADGFMHLGPEVVRVAVGAQPDPLSRDRNTLLGAHLPLAAGLR